MKSEIHSYSSPYNYGHRDLAELFDGQVVAEEKIDGSQFSFGIKDGELFMRSRRVAVLEEDAGMFGLAVQAVVAVREMLHAGWTYRCEYLSKPKHNTLAYDRVPENNIILFDIDRGDQDYLSPEDAENEATCLGLEFVPWWIVEEKPSLEQIEKWLQAKSVLGNVPVEGIVFKNYAKLDPHTKKTLMGKFVSEKFREKHSGDWAKRNPGKKAFVQNIIDEHATEARWMKAIQHLQETEEINGEMRDIPKLLKEISTDVLDDCGDEIKERLFKHFWGKEISRGITRGFPEFYREYIASEEAQCEREN